MKLLHLCPDYPYTDIYRELISVIDKYGYEQVVYIPLKNETDIGKRINEDCKRTEFIYSQAFNNIDRLFYHHKVNKIFSDVQAKMQLDEVSLVHAHFLYSMGGIALKLKHKEGIDYIVSVRNSDVNLFFKYGLWLRKVAIAIMLEASNIIFISPSYRKRVLETYIPNIVRQKIERKSLVLPNGINKFWLNNACNITRIVREGEIRLIYIGELTKNKNVKTCIKVVKELSNKGYKATLKIIGEGPEEKTLRKMAAGNDKGVFFYGFIDNKRTIAELMAQSDIFIMPSLTETFGVAYIEAMSQGLPLIYTHNEGIDGFYQDGQIGYAVNPLNVDEIILRIEEIFSDYDNVSMRCKIESHNFSWDKIGNDYVNNIIKTHQISVYP